MTPVAHFERHASVASLQVGARQQQVVSFFAILIGNFISLVIGYFVGLR